MLTASQLSTRLQGLLSGECSSETIANWAADQHFKYENMTLQFEPGYESLILDILVDLIHNEDEHFRMAHDEIKQKIASLDANVVV
jgi:hypothetical protein